MNKNFPYCFICLIFSFFSFAQNEEIERELLLNSNILNPVKVELKNVNNISQDYVIIQQIGDDNKSNVKIDSENSGITVFQNGVENESIIDKYSVNIQESVLQLGNSNFFLDFSTVRQENSSVNVNQSGNDLSIINSGNNSISNSMTINQSGFNQSIIILNNN